MSKLGLSAGRPSETNKERLLAAVRETDPAPPETPPAPAAAPQKVAPSVEKGEGDVRINFEASKSIHRRVKIHSVQTGKSIREIMTDLIDQHLPQYDR